MAECTDLFLSPHPARDIAYQTTFNWMRLLELVPERWTDNGTRGVGKILQLVVRDDEANCRNGWMNDHLHQTRMYIDGTDGEVHGKVRWA